MAIPGTEAFGVENLRLAVKFASQPIKSALPMPIDVARIPSFQVKLRGMTNYTHATFEAAFLCGSTVEGQATGAEWPIFFIRIDTDMGSAYSCLFQVHGVIPVDFPLVVIPSMSASLSHDFGVRIWGLGQTFTLDSPLHVLTISTNTLGYNDSRAMFFRLYSGDMSNSYQVNSFPNASLVFEQSYNAVPFSNVVSFDLNQTLPAGDYFFLTRQQSNYTKGDAGIAYGTPDVYAAGNSIFWRPKSGGSMLNNVSIDLKFTITGYEP